MTPTLESTKSPRANKRLEATGSDDEPLIDTTEALPLRSKKIFRQKRKMVKKSKIEAAKPHLHTLPPEIILEIFSSLRPNDIIRYQQTSKYNESFVEQHENSLAKDLISNRYAVLSKCFPRPFLLCDVDENLHSVLQDPRYQQRLNIHRLPYQHISPADPQLICGCVTCVLAWNNLCLILDLAHWTRNALAVRQPIPIIKRGSYPDWNIALMTRHAVVVRRALSSPLFYALILQQHLHTTVWSIQRFADRKTAPRFNLSDADIHSETDAFASRQGPNCMEFPFYRDIYYTLQTYLPNRRWSKEEMRWLYYPADQHYRDLEWVRNHREKAPVVDMSDISRSGNANGHGEESNETQEIETKPSRDDPGAPMESSLFSDGIRAH